MVCCRSNWVFKLLALLLCVAATPHLGYTQTPVCYSAGNNPNKDPDFVALKDPIVFVSGPEYPGSGNKVDAYLIGQDVLDFNNAHPSQLYILIPGNKDPQLLFPIPGVHDSIIDDAPNKGAVGDTPSISEDGNSLYFAWVHTAQPQGSFDSDYNKPTGSDIYRIDLSPILANHNFNPVNLVATRLTKTIDKYSEAMNPQLAKTVEFSTSRGIYHYTPVEMRTEEGLKLVYSSDAKRLENADDQRAYRNRNFNIYTADILPDGTLGNHRQFQYYTTTSAISPFRMRNGIAYSMQATTADSRHWELQRSESNGRWFPLYGYGENPESAHLGTFCRKDIASSTAPAGDYLVSTLYYNQNNNGFGGLDTVASNYWGVNQIKNTNNGIEVGAFGKYRITANVTSSDDPSGKDPNTGEYYGKMSSPSCGRPDELYFTYSMGSTNGRRNDADGKVSDYRPTIWLSIPNAGKSLSGLDTFDPVVDRIGRNGGKRIGKIVDCTQTPDPKSGLTYWAAYPVPIISWKDRVGDAQQQFSSAIIDRNNGILPGLPYSVVGTSTLWNTDMLPLDCKLGAPWTPNKSWGNSVDGVIRGTSFLSVVLDQNNPCMVPSGSNKNPGAAGLDPSFVYGIQINMTSNEAVNPNKVGYADKVLSNSTARLETVKMLGIVKSDVTGTVPGTSAPDQSFKAVIPANVPFEFKLLGTATGLAIAQVNSWHSMKARETRTSCGGCHQHNKDGVGYAFQGTTADKNPAVDLVSQTPYIEYDAFCKPQLFVSNTPTMNIPTFSDVYPGMDQYCGSCHNSLISSDQTALTALSFSDESTAVRAMTDRNYIDFGDGVANSSPAFWAARGMRTDGRYNDDSSYFPNYAQGKYGYRYTAHPNLCDGKQPSAARWVYQFGLWMDNMAVRNTGTTYTGSYDRFHPSVDGALSNPNCSPEQIRIGFWDDSNVNSLEIYVNGNQVDGGQYKNLPNGSILYSLVGLNSSDSLTIIDIDPTGNRQKYTKSIETLTIDCVDAPPPTPTPTPTITATPDPSGGIAGAPSPSLSLSVGGSQRLGSALTFTQSADAAMKTQLICAAKTSPPWCIKGTSACMNIALDRLSSRTASSSAFYATLSAGVPKKLTVDVPRSSIFVGKTIYCQAIGATAPHTDEVLSNVVRIKISKPHGASAPRKINTRSSSFKRGSSLFTESRSWKPWESKSKAKTYSTSQDKIRKTLALL